MGCWYRFALWMTLATVVLAVRSSAADDVADEADLAFTLGAKAYQRGDYSAALQQFLLSQRLVPNKNVVFNIARTYEKLQQYPQAYRYFSRALEDEKDTSARSKIQAALEELRKHVGVLNVATRPAGATLYLERRDLGAVGTSPQRLGVGPGSYKLIADLQGYHPTQVVLRNVEPGKEVPVVLTLQQILGRVTVSSPHGSELRVDDVRAAPRCKVPCTLDLPPGSHVLFFDQRLFQSKELTIDVVADRVLEVDTVLEPLTGSLLVSTDEPGALVRVDGLARGFSPAILTLPVGVHDLAVELEGFRNEAQRTVIQAGRETKMSFQMTRLDEVEAASRIRERVERAPSSVSIVPRRELQAFAYPTIAEALRGRPGVYLWDDLSYVTVGLRGLGRLGSYGNRVLVLSDGHPLNDNWIGSSYVGYDALTDLDDVERIELVRGPGSVLYGSNAFAGVINLVSRERAPGVSTAISTQGNGVARGRMRADAKLDGDGHIWGSVAGARGEGRDYYFPEFEEETSGGVVRNKDGFVAGTTRGGMRRGWFVAQWWLHSHEKEIPTGDFETDITDPRMTQHDTRAFLELRAEPRPWGVLRSMTRAYLNIYRFQGRYPRVPDEGGLELDTYRGQWVGLEQRLIATPFPELRLTVGADGQLHYQVEQYAEDGSGPFLNDSHPYQVGAVYALADADLTKRLRISAGTRYDAYTNFGRSLNPRAAIIVTPYADGTLKLLGGKAFRAPSVYELYYNDGGYTQIKSTTLGPEEIYSGELEHSHRFSPTVVGTASVYTNIVRHLVVERGEGNATDPLYYDNSSTPLVVVGGEASVQRDFRGGYMLGANYGISRARFVAGGSLWDLLAFERDPEKREVTNVPMHLAQLRGAAPILSRALLASTRLSFESGRYDRYENVDDPPQGRTEPAVVWDIVLTGEEPKFGLNYALGVYNAFDWRYSIPAGTVSRQETLPQNGRTFLASVEASF